MKEKILGLLAQICESDEVMEDTKMELFQSGLLDSLGFAEFLVELEEETGIVISPSEIEREDIDTPEKIVALAMGRSTRG